MDTLFNSTYSRHFNTLMYLGSWVVNPENPKRVKYYAAYKVVMTIVALGSIFFLVADFYMVYGDFKEMTWNLCVTALFIGSLVKNFVLFHRNKTLNRLRSNLHRDEESRTTPEDIIIHNMSRKELRVLRTSYYGVAAVFIPVWLLTRYLSSFWGIREYPIPMRFPFKVDRNDETQFNIAYICLSIAGVFGIVLVMETELAMFSLFIQLSREYNILLKDIPKLNDIYEKKGNSAVEINPILKIIKTRGMVKKLFRRQQELVQYIEDFEQCYNVSMLLQFFDASLLVIVSAMQIILMSGDFSGDLAYQLAYICLVLSDLFLICYFSSRLIGQCKKVGEVAYDTLWYRMNPNVQKDLEMIIKRSQRPRFITGGKVMKLNLRAFMHTMRNVYSWLALFRQLEVKQRG